MKSVRMRLPLQGTDAERLYRHEARQRHDRTDAPTHVLADDVRLPFRDPRMIGRALAYSHCILNCTSISNLPCIFHLGSSCFSTCDALLHHARTNFRYAKVAALRSNSISPIRPVRSPILASLINFRSSYPPPTPSPPQQARLISLAPLARTYGNTGCTPSIRSRERQTNFAPYSRAPMGQRRQRLR